MAGFRAQSKWCRDFLAPQQSSNSFVVAGLLPDGKSFADDGLRYCAVRVVRDCVAHQHAGIGAAVVGDGGAAVGSHHVGVEVDEPLAGDGSAGCAHAVRGVAGGATEAGVDVVAVLDPACVLHDLIGQVVAFATERVGPNDTEVGIGKQVGDQSAGSWGLAELVIPLQNVGPL